MSFPMPHRFQSKFLLGFWGLFLVILITPPPGRGYVADPPPHEYKLRFYHTHTNERMEIVYRRGDSYLPAALDRLDHFLRDPRTGDVRHFDLRLFDLLYDLTGPCTMRAVKST